MSSASGKTRTLCGHVISSAQMFPHGLKQAVRAATEDFTSFLYGKLIQYHPDRAQLLQHHCGAECSSYRKKRFQLRLMPDRRFPNPNVLWTHRLKPIEFLILIYCPRFLFALTCYKLYQTTKEKKLPLPCACCSLTVPPACASIPRRSVSRAQTAPPDPVPLPLRRSTRPC